MISFVWSSWHPFIAGSGGSETYTAGQVRELTRRGIPARIIVLNHGIERSQQDFPDIEFLKLNDASELSELDDIIVFVIYALNVKTKRQSYVILHIPPPSHAQPDSLFNLQGLAGKRLMAPSKYSAKIWSHYYAKNSHKIPLIPIVYPFADPIFAKVKRPAHTTDEPRLLFAGRLHPEKGIYTLLEALQLHPLKNLDFHLTVTTAGDHTDEGSVIRKMLEVHPRITLASARRNSHEMAELMANHDIALMPTTNIYWRESFGIVSVEAQHAGCRVVASKSGGLPETNCGGLLTVEADNPMALAKTIVKAIEMGPLTSAERQKACSKFTVAESVDLLLAVLKYPVLLPAKQLHSGPKPMSLLYPKLSLNRANSKQSIL